MGKKYRLSKKIGGGSFGDIFHGELAMRAPCQVDILLAPLAPPPYRAMVS